MAGLMDIGKSGLQSYREALSVTGQNIANINTDGYKRREASMAEVTGSAGGINSLPSQVGLGVRVEEVRRSFDEFLLNKARNATSYAASANSYVEAISQLEDIILPGDANIGSSIGRFMETLQEVAANPSDIAPRIVAVQSGETLADMFHQTAALIEELQDGVNTQSDQAMTEINLLTKSLANINRNIASSAGKAQNALLDNRDAIIDKISEYVEVTVTLESTGAATLQLGGSGNGPLFVKNEKAYTLSSSPSSEDIEFYLAEGADLNRTSQVTNGRLRGLADAFKAASSALNSVHQLAYQLINDLNQVHRKGIDMEGQPGVDMFHGVAFDAVPSVSNLGNGAAMVMITDINQVSGKAVRFSYDSEKNLWHAFDANNKALASARNQMILPGMSIEFSGSPVSGDEMMLTPAIGAAHNIQFNLTRPEQIAAAEGFLVSVDINNQSNAAIDVITSTSTPKASGLPNLQDVIANTHSTVTSSQFIRDGAVAVIPANTDHIDLISMIQQSTAQFGIGDEAMPQISTISLEIDDGVNAPKTYHFDLSGYAETINQERPENDNEPFTWYDAGQIATLMNVGALTATSTDVDDQNQLINYTLNDLGGYANGKVGIFSLALKENSFLSGQITFGNAPTTKAAITDRIDAASDIQIFTREGRHIAGSSYLGVENLIKTENGFLAEAEYRDDYLNMTGTDAYMGIGLSVVSDMPGEILNATETANGYEFRFDRLFGIDTAEASPFGRRASAAQFDYKLSIDSFDIALTEANVDGENGEALASAALAAIRAQAPIPSMTGVSAMVESITPLTLTDAQREQLDANARLSLQHEGIDYLITENNGQYTVTGGRASSISLSFDADTNILSSNYVNLPQEGDSVTLRFEGEDYQISITNGEVMVSGGEVGRLSASITSAHKLHIVANGGSLNMDEITILDDTVIAGNLAAARRYGLISDNDTAQTVFSNDSENYVIPNFDVSQNGDLLVVEKRDTYGVDPMVVTAEATSNAGQRITLTDLPDEELIIFLTGSDDGNGVRARNISASYDMLAADALLPKRDISITITDATSGKVEFIDTATGTSIASRYLDDQGKADAIGYDITLTGVVADQDAFYITGNQDGIHDNRNLLDIIALQDGQLDKGGFQKIFSGLVSEIGADIQASKINADAANNLKDASLEAEAMYSGVNLDTEASKLIEFQQAYQASARILQTAREIFDTLLQTI